MSALSDFRCINPGLWLEAQAERAIRDSLENGLTLTLVDVADIWKAHIAFGVLRQRRAGIIRRAEFADWAIRWLAVE